MNKYTIISLSLGGPDDQAKIEDAVNAKNQEGYEVKSIIPTPNGWGQTWILLELRLPELSLMDKVVAFFKRLMGKKC